MIPFVTRRSPVYTGTGAVAAYAFAFKVFSKSDISVKVTDTSGTLTALTLDVDYTVVLNADQDAFPGGTITLTAGNLALGYQLVIVGGQDYSQTTQLPTGGSYNAVIVERAIDRAVVMAQQLKELSDRSLRLPAGESSLSTELVSAALRADRLQGYATGTGAPTMSTFTMTQVAAVVAAVYAASAGPLDALSFLQAGAGARSRTAQDKAREIISPEDYDLATAAGTALMEIEAAFPAGVGPRIPTGTFTLDQPVVLDENRMNIQGAGRWASIFAYNRTDAGPAIKWNRTAGVDGYNQGRIADVAFQSNNSTAKTAIELVNVANVIIERIATNSGVWPGDSIGVRTRGRQLVVLRDSEIGCNRPIVLSPNATYPSLATDHFLLENLELVGQDDPSWPAGPYATRDVVEIESGVCFSSTTLRHVSITRGRHGIYWNDTASTAASFALLIDELRTEQGMDPAAYSIYLASTAQNLQNVRITNSILDSRRNGIYLRNAQRVEIDNVTYGGSAGKTALDITMVAGGRLILRNFLSNGGTVTITNGRCIRKDARASGADPLVRNEEWIFDSATSEGTQQSDVYHTGRPVTVAAGATTVLTNGSFVGKVTISTSELVTGEFHLGGTGNTVKEIADPFGFFGVPGALGVIYNVKQDGSNNYIFENLRAFPVTIYPYRIGFGQ